MLRVPAGFGTCANRPALLCTASQNAEVLCRRRSLRRPSSAVTGPLLGLRRPQHAAGRVRRNRNVVRNAGIPAGGMNKAKSSRSSEIDTPAKALLAGVGIFYITIMILVPAANVFYQAFAKGPGPFFANIVEPDFLQAVKLTLMLAAIAVPINTIWGVCCALMIARNEFPGKLFLSALLDLPFSISPVVTGLMLILLYGREGWFAPVIRATGFNVVYAFPGMALATLFVTLPYTVRELIPILEGMDLSEEEAARTMGASDWQVFWNVTVPNIRYGLLYGIILTNARAMGEFGAVAVISGNVIGKTQTLTLFVESSYKEYNTEAAFSAAVLLSFLAVITLILKFKLEASEETAH